MNELSTCKINDDHQEITKHKDAINEEFGEGITNDIFTLYFHDPNDENWSLTSYKRLHDISTVQDFWKTFRVIKDKLKQGIFFVMRESSFPCWDDPSNINGGVLSIKVLKENVVAYLEELYIRFLGETLLVPELQDNWEVINGISTSPKRYFCIIKIWLKTNDYNDKKFFRLPEKYYGDIIYRENIENIQNNHD